MTKYFAFAVDQTGKAEIAVDPDGFGSLAQQWSAKDVTEFARTIPEVNPKIDPTKPFFLYLGYVPEEAVKRRSGFFKNFMVVKAVKVTKEEVTILCPLDPTPWH